MKTKIISLVLVLALAVSLLCSCGECKHEYGEWEKGNANQHSKTCTKCGDVQTEAHAWVLQGGDEGEMLSYKCSVCGNTKQEKNNKYDPWAKEQEAYVFDWEETPLLHNLNKNSNYGELTSGVSLYMTGDSQGSDTDTLTKDILDRNTKAQQIAKVVVENQYFEENGKESWGSSKPAIEQLNTGSGSAAPDMYTDYLNDMNGCAYTGTFANILQGEYMKDNFFGFLSDYYDEAENDRGYMYEYMNLIALSKSRMYLIASDYYIDLIRSMFVLPASVDILESAAAQFVTQDLNQDGTVDSVDFLQLVQDKQFTWAKVAEYSEAVQTPGTASGFVDALEGSIVGLIFDDTSGMDRSAFMYASNISVLDREVDPTSGEYTFTYKTGDDLATFYSILNQLKNLFAVGGGFVGVQSKGYNGTSNAIKDTTAVNKSIPACKEIFAKGRALFCGPMMLGAIEDDTMASMWNTDENKHGFVVCPVPMYEGMDDYSTYIHNVGKPGAIASATTKFTQCSAYLNYQCTHSNDILEDFFTWTIEIDKAQGTDLNVAILSEMRSQIHNGVDKIVEDLLWSVMPNKTEVTPDPSLGLLTVKGDGSGDTGAMTNLRWHEFCAAGATAYAQVDLLRPAIEQLTETKQIWLDENLNGANSKYGIPATE